MFGPKRSKECVYTFETALPQDAVVPNETCVVTGGSVVEAVVCTHNRCNTSLIVGQILAAVHENGYRHTSTALKNG